MSAYLRGRKKLFSSVVIGFALVMFSIFGPAIAADESEAVTVTNEEGQVLAVDSLNDRSNTNKLVLFDPTFSYFTETSGSSYKVVLEKVERTEYMVIDSGSGDQAIPENGVVLSTNGDTSDSLPFLKGLDKGEKVIIEEPIEKRYPEQLDDINPTDESNPDGAPFPGNRGANQLLLYTSDFGTSTGTNPYGYEITVVEGVVTKVGGGDSDIPAQGFVVSGHGTEATYLKNAEIGMKVEYDQSGSVELIQDASTFIYKSEQALSEAKASLEEARNHYVDAAYDQSEAAIARAEELLEQAEQVKEEDPEQALDLTEQATQAAYDGYYYSLPSEVGEQRAVWYRPEEKDLEDVRTTLDRMEKAGFNSLYLETTFWGYTIFPSETMEAYGLPKQHPNFADKTYGDYGSDILKAFVEEGKKRGITVQSWTDGFMVGHISLGVSPQFEVYPEWTAVQRNDEPGTIGTDSKSNYYWLDMANPDVQEFMLEVYEEQQKNYDITGLNIDYMRYPHHSFEESYSFSDSNRNRFEEVYGVDPMELDESDDLWEEWEAWLREQENVFVDKLHDQSKAMDPSFMLTATPEPGAEATLISDWVDDIDGVIPQAYGHDFKSIQATVQASKELTPDSMMYYTGIYSFYHHLSEKAAVDDVQSAGYGTSGVNMFAFGQASAPSVDALGKGPWREAAVNPGETPKEAVLATVQQLIDQTKTIYIPEGAIQHTEGRKLINTLKKWEVMMKRPDHSLKYSKVEKELDKTYAVMEELESLEPIVQERITSKLDQSGKWLYYHYNK